MTNTVMTSIKLQANLHKQLQRRIIDDGYGMRGKSKWIIESVESLLRNHDYPSYVEIAEDMNDLSDITSIRFPKDLVLRIEKAAIEIRKKYPMIEGVKSNLIRASILQRLLRESTTSVTEVKAK